MNPIKLFATMIIMHGIAHGAIAPRALAPWINFGQKFAVAMEIQNIMEMVVLDTITGDEPKSGAGFTDYLRKNMRNRPGQNRDTSLDVWGHSYAFHRYGRTMTVASAGPDGRFGTDDDISLTYTWP